MSLKTLVDELVSLNEDELARRVIDDSDVQCCLSKLQDMLDVETEPVRHSYWESYDTSAFVGADDFGEPKWAVRHFYVCHNRRCRYKNAIKSKYCPNCGAKMDGGADNG